MSAAETPPDDTFKDEFVSFLSRFDRGRLADSATDAMYELTARVIETGKPGTLQFTVKIGPAKGADDQVKITAALVTKLPQPEPREQIFFVTDDGNLSRSDPSQSAFDFPPIPTKKAEK